jgi:hypothetical protein
VSRRVLAAAALAGALALAAGAGPARAHTMSDGHLALVPDADALVGTLDVAVRDLHDQIGLDPDGDRRITGAELEARRDAIARYVRDHLAIRSDRGACAIATGVLGVVDRPDGAHVAIAIDATCAAPPTTVEVDYRLLYELDAQHRGLIHIGDGRAIARDGGGPVTVVVRASLLPRLAAALPGGACTVVAAGIALALGVALFLARRATRWAPATVAAIALGAAAAVGGALYRLVL